MRFPTLASAVLNTLSVTLCDDPAMAKLVRIARCCRSSCCCWADVLAPEESDSIPEDEDEGVSLSRTSAVKSTAGSGGTRYVMPSHLQTAICGTHSGGGMEGRERGGASTEEGSK